MEAYQQVLGEVNERHFGAGVVISVPEQDIHAPRSPLDGLQKQQPVGNETIKEEPTNPKTAHGVSDHVHIPLVRATLRVIRNLHPKDAENAFEEIKKAA